MKFGLFYIFLSLGQILQIHSKCGFKVLTPDGLPVVPEDDEAFIGSSKACPMYQDTLVCCNDLQDGSMVSSFQALQATFGSQGGGCDICSANMMRFWCDYTCNPKQKDFLHVEGYEEVPDPQNDKKNITVQVVTIDIQPQLACEVWSSCKRTQFASQVSAMQSPGGFFNFQGENAVSQGLQLIKMRFTEIDTAMKLDNVPECNQVLNITKEVDGKTIYVDPHGFEVYQNCSCNNCDLSCSSTNILYKPTGVMEGFNTILVLIVWGVVILISFIITLYRFLKNYKQIKRQPKRLALQKSLIQPDLEVQN